MTHNPNATLFCLILTLLDRITGTVSQSTDIINLNQYTSTQFIDLNQTTSTTEWIQLPTSTTSVLKLITEICSLDSDITYFLAISYISVSLVALLIVSVISFINVKYLDVSCTCSSASGK